MDVRTVDFTFSASYITLWALVVFQGLLILALLRQLGELRRWVAQGHLPGEDRLPAGSSAPEFAGLDFRSGRRVSSLDLDGTGAVILFLSACDVCIRLADSLRQTATSDLPPIVAFCQGGEGLCSGIVRGLAPGVPLLLENSEETAALYRVFNSPTAIVIDGKRKIRGYGHPENAEDLKKLFVSSLGLDSPEPNHEERVHQAVFDPGATQ